MSVIQGLDTIPRGVLEEFSGVFRELLPDWQIDGEYGVPGTVYSIFRRSIELSILSLGNSGEFRGQEFRGQYTWNSEDSILN